MSKLAFLGTGLIGAGLAEAAARRGETVSVWNRSLDKAKALEAFGARACSSAAAAVAGVERVHLALTDDAAVDAVLESCGAALGDAVVVDHSTASPAGTKARAQRLAQRGVAFLHAPVFMSPKMCREGGGLMLASGPGGVYARVEAGLKPMSGQVHYLGERLDLAAAYKLFGNAMIMTIVGGLADVYAMAAALDIPAPEAHALFSKFNPAGTISFRGASMAQGDFRPSFELSMARKDLRLMMETAQAGGRELGLIPALAQWMDQLIREGHGGEDVGALAIGSVGKR